MKTIKGWTIIMTGVILYLYVGMWLGFIGGLACLAEIIAGDEWVPIDVSLGITRFVFTILVGTVSGSLFMIYGINKLRNPSEQAE